MGFVCLRIWRQYLLWAQSSQPSLFYSCSHFLTALRFFFPLSFSLLSAPPTHLPSISQRRRRFVNLLYLVLEHGQTLEGSGKLVFIFYKQHLPPSLRCSLWWHWPLVITRVTLTLKWHSCNFELRWDFLPKQCLLVNETVFFSLFSTMKDRHMCISCRLAPTLILHMGIITVLLLLK